MIKKNKLILKTNFPIILASKSNIRKKILHQTGLKFEQVPSNVNEENIKMKFKKKKPDYLAKKLAEEKALAVSNLRLNSYVIGSDQICVVQNQILNKPKFKVKAIKQLSMLSGRSHKQISAISLCYNKKILWSHSEIVTMKMKKLSINLIKKYVDLDLPLYSCGSYKYESFGKYLFSKVNNYNETILGLPILSLLDILHKKKIIRYV